MNQSTETAPQVTDDALTPLAQLLLKPGADPGSPLGQLDYPAHEDVSNQISALVSGVGALDLGSMAQISVTGSDRLRWLNGMVTNNIQTLEEGRGNYNFILNAQGRIQGDGYIYRQGEQLVIETSRSQTQRLLGHLDHFIIMDDVELKPLAGLTALGLAGPGAADLLKRLGIDHAGLQPLSTTRVNVAGVETTLIRGYEVMSPRYELWFERQYVGALWQALLDAGAAACSAAAAEALRILEGIPAYGIDLHDRDLPQETGQARALNFSKGCYLGQEIVERIRSRGNVHRIFSRLELIGTIPTTPAELRSEGKAIGQITSAAAVFMPGGTCLGGTRIVALGFVRVEAANISMEYDGGMARRASDIASVLVDAGRQPHS